MKNLVNQMTSSGRGIEIENITGISDKLLSGDSLSEVDRLNLVRMIHKISESNPFARKLSSELNYHKNELRDSYGRQLTVFGQCQIDYMKDYHVELDEELSEGLRDQYKLIESKSREVVLTHLSLELALKVMTDINELIAICHSRKKRGLL